MDVRCRVFASGSSAPSPSEILEVLQALRIPSTSDFGGDEAGWFRGSIHTQHHGVVDIERYFASEEGIRQELNTWAAWLEIIPDNPLGDTLMAKVVQAAQVFTVHLSVNEERVSPALSVCESLCRFLANRTSGLYQIDGRGFFDSDGMLLLAEEAVGESPLS